MAIEDNKGHSGQGAEGNDPPYQSPAKTDAGPKTEKKEESDRRPGDTSGKETKAGGEAAPGGNKR